MPVAPTKIYKWRLANLIGLQVGRVVAARTLLFVRRSLARPQLSDRTGQSFSVANQLVTNGFAVVPNFLSSPALAEVREEFRKALSSRELITKKVVDPAGLLRTSSTLSSSNRRSFAATAREFLGADFISGVLQQYDGRKSLRSNGSTFQLSFWETRWCPSPTDAEPTDHTNTELHSDSFQSVVKCFFYLDDVSEEDGPHVYVPHSHRLTLRRLAFEYLNSISDMRESPRVLPNRGWACARDPVDMVYPGNTLVITDTFGFHKAKMPALGRCRRIVYLQYRSPPFR